MHSYMIDLVLKEKREEMLRIAAQSRLIAEYEAGRKKRVNRIGLAAGKFLVYLGERLKNRYEPKVELPTG